MKLSQNQPSNVEHVTEFIKKEKRDIYKCNIFQRILHMWKVSIAACNVTYKVYTP